MEQDYSFSAVETLIKDLEAARCADARVS